MEFKYIDVYIYGSDCGYTYCIHCTGAWTLLVVVSLPIVVITYSAIDKPALLLTYCIIM